MGFKLVRITEERVKFTIRKELDEETILYINQFIFRNLEILEKVTIDMKQVKSIGMPGYRFLKTNCELLEYSNIGFRLINLSSRTRTYIKNWELSGLIGIRGKGVILDCVTSREKKETID
ncbi:MAG: STAS domain-containing protein [Erysipelotrichaceae bacterium]